MRRSLVLGLASVAALAVGVALSPRLGADVYLALGGAFLLVVLAVAGLMVRRDRRADRELARTIVAALQDASVAELDQSLAVDPVAPFCFVNGVALPVAEVRKQRALLADGTVVRLPDTPASAKARPGA